MRTVILFFIFFSGIPARADRVLLGVLDEVESTTNYDTAEGFRAVNAIFCQNLSLDAQTVKIEILSETVKYHMCVSNQNASIGAIWAASGSCARVQFLDSTLPELLPANRVRTMTLAGASEGIAIVDLGCVSKLDGLYCSQSDSSKWQQFNFNRLSGRAKPNHCKTDADVDIPNCVVNATATYRVRYRVTVDGDRGAVLCSHAIKVYLAGAEDYEFGQSSKSMNGGRPF